MNEIYVRYLSLTAGQRKLLCFLAYTGRASDAQSMSLFRKHEGLRSEELTKTLRSLTMFFKSQYFSYYDEYWLHPYHQAPLLVYLLCENPIWLREFETHFKRLQETYVPELLSSLRLCIMGKELQHVTLTTNKHITQALVPLAGYKQFLPYLTIISPQLICDFVGQALVWQAENDSFGTDNALGTLARRYYTMLSTERRYELQTMVALYEYYFYGRFDTEASTLNTLYGNILSGLHALYTGSYDSAFTHLNLAVRENNRTLESPYKGFFRNIINNYVLVLACHFKESDQHKKLAALVKKEHFVEEELYFCPASLAEYLTEKKLPSNSRLKARQKDALSGPPILRHFFLLTARFFGLDCDPSLVDNVPRMCLLRHELSPWVKLDDADRQKLEHDFGGPPLQLISEETVTDDDGMLHL